jgi:hypothetical protein
MVLSYHTKEQPRNRTVIHVSQHRITMMCCAVKLLMYDCCTMSYSSWQMNSFNTNGLFLQRLYALSDSV